MLKSLLHEGTKNHTLTSMIDYLVICSLNDMLKEGSKEKSKNVTESPVQNANQVYCIYCICSLQGTCSLYLLTFSLIIYVYIYTIMFHTYT